MRKFELVEELKMDNKELMQSSYQLMMIMMKLSRAFFILIHFMRFSVLFGEVFGQTALNSLTFEKEFFRCLLAGFFNVSC